MSDVKPRRISVARIVLIGVGLLLMGGVGFSLWCWSLARHGWDEMERQVREALRDAEAPRASLPVLRGDPDPGDAADDYSSISIAESYSPGWDQVRRMVEEPFKADPAKAAKEVEAYRAVFDALRRGARREFRASTFKFPSQFWRLGTLVSCRSKLLVLAGRKDEACDLLLALAKYCRDLACASPGWSRTDAIVTLEKSLDEFRDLVLPRDLGPAELSAVDESLAVLDSTLPDVAFMEIADVTGLGEEFLQARDLYTELRKPRCMCLEHVCPPWGAWRFGFSDRLMVATAFREAVVWAKQAEEFRSANWSEARPRGEELVRQMRRSSNPTIHSHVMALAHRDGQPREIRARLRLLRVAVRFQATGELLDLADPLGGRLLRQQSGSRLKIWSVGRDGVDNGGAANWKSQGQGKDIVLELDR